MTWMSNARFHVQLPFSRDVQLARYNERVFDKIIFGENPLDTGSISTKVTILRVAS